MKAEDAKNKMCPFQNNPETAIDCVAEKCMAWNAEGHCELIHGISGWLSMIANRMPTLTVSVAE